MVRTRSKHQNAGRFAPLFKRFTQINLNNTDKKILPLGTMYNIIKYNKQYFVKLCCRSPCGERGLKYYHDTAA